MTKPLLPEPSQNELSMALCAIRYCMGRRSYIVSDGVAWALRYGQLSPWIRSVVVRDIETEVERIDQARAAGLEPLLTLGDQTDELAWRAVLAELRAMI